MIYPARGQSEIKGLDKFTGPFGNEFWFWNSHLMAFRHRMAEAIVVKRNSLGNACGRALSKSFGPDPHNTRRVSGEAFAEKFQEAFGTEAGTPTIQYDTEHKGTLPSATPS